MGQAYQEKAKRSSQTVSAFRRRLQATAETEMSKEHQPKPRALCVFVDRCGPGYPWALCVAKDELELFTLLPLPPKCWHSRQAPVDLVSVVVGVEPRVSWVLGKWVFCQLRYTPSAYLSFLTVNKGAVLRILHTESSLLLPKGGGRDLVRDSWCLLYSVHPLVLYEQLKTDKERERERGKSINKGFLPILSLILQSLGREFTPLIKIFRVVLQCKLQLSLQFYSQDSFVMNPRYFSCLPGMTMVNRRGLWATSCWMPCGASNKDCSSFIQNEFLIIPILKFNTVFSIIIRESISSKII